MRAVTPLVRFVPVARKMIAVNQRPPDRLPGHSSRKRAILPAQAPAPRRARAISHRMRWQSATGSCRPSPINSLNSKKVRSRSTLMPPASCTLTHVTARSLSAARERAFAPAIDARSRAFAAPIGMNSPSGPSLPPKTWISRTKSFATGSAFQGLLRNGKAGKCRWPRGDEAVDRHRQIVAVASSRFWCCRQKPSIVSIDDLQSRLLDIPHIEDALLPHRRSCTVNATLASAKLQVIELALHGRCIFLCCLRQPSDWKRHRRRLRFRLCFRRLSPPFNNKAHWKNSSLKHPHTRYMLSTKTSSGSSSS